MVHIYAYMVLKRKCLRQFMIGINAAHIFVMCLPHLYTPTHLFIYPTSGIYNILSITQVCMTHTLLCNLETSMLSHSQHVLQVRYGVTDYIAIFHILLLSRGSSGFDSLYRK